ncbi:MAG: exodeoxyribonuclease X [Ulvibacter sp.]|jgi:exodeoxyribonuclease X
MNLIFLDTETTGIDNARIIQLAYKNRGSDEMFIEYYKPPIPIEFGAMGTHHITEEMVANKLPFSETNTCKELPKKLRDSVFVAHNAKYDIGILNNEGIEVEDFICTYKVAYNLYDLSDHKLQSLRYRWGVKIDEAKAHDASGDVMVLEKIFDYMLEDYISKNQITEDEVIKKFIEISMKPNLLRKITFGKHSGTSFDDLRKNNRDYLIWMRDKMENKNEDLEFTINHHLD